MTQHIAGRHRAEVRPRYGRIAVLGSSVAVVLIAVLGGTGALPSSADDPSDKDPGVATGDPGTGSGTDNIAANGSGASSDDQQTPDARTTPDQTADTASADESGTSDTPDESKSDELEPVDPGRSTPIDVALPGDSGSGKRVVFSESRQRVWLVTEDEKIRRTYLVSGSAYDNLDHGTFQVYSRDKDAVGIDDSGTMKFFVRFTKGPSGAAIGFHDIPVLTGLPVQSIAQLGTPLSHGCIRQQREDAVALWKFAPIGTTVVVTA